MFYKTIAALLSLLLLSSCLVCIRIPDWQVWMPVYLLGGASLLLSGALLLHLWLTRKKFQLNYNIVDISLFAFLGYGSVRLLFTPNWYAYTNQFALLYCLFFLYLIFKYLYSSIHHCKLQTIVISVFVFSGLFQAILGILNYLRVYHITEDNTGICGTFPNSGLYGNFIAIAFVFSLGLFSETKNKRLKWFCLATSLILLAALPLTCARTAWLAAITGSAVIILKLLKGSAFVHKITKTNLRFAAIFFGAALLILSACKLYKYKPESANGRMLIYKVTSTMIQEHIVFGVGFNRFKANYNNYQAAYFAANPSSSFKIYADNVKTSFNEFLELLAELGIVGLSLIVFLVIIVLRAKPKEPAYFVLPAKAAFIGLLVCCCFSYPLHSWQAAISYMFILALLSVQLPARTFRFASSWPAKLALSIMMASAFFLAKNLVDDFKARLAWKKTFEFTENGDFVNIAPDFHSIYERLKYDDSFLYNYGANLVEYNPTEGIKILKQCNALLADNDVLLYLGNGCRSIKEYTQAEQYYLQSSLMVPSKFQPRYELFCLYVETQQYEKALRIAQEISAMEVKIPSGTIDFIKQEVNLWLRKTKKLPHSKDCKGLL